MSLLFQKPVRRLMVVNSYVAPIELTCNTILNSIQTAYDMVLALFVSLRLGFYFWDSSEKSGLLRGINCVKSFY